MFHHSNFIILFYIFFASAALIIFLQINATVYASRENTAYSLKVTSASQAAMDSVDYKKMLEGKNIWEERISRDTALNVFYNTLSRSLGETRINENIQVSTPLILFVDRDGYYIGWNATFDRTNMADPGKENEFVNSMQVTRLIPWSYERAGYTVRYSLYGEIISVTTPDGEILKSNFPAELLRPEDPADPDAEPAADVLNRYTPAYFQGQNFTFTCGLSFGF